VRLISATTTLIRPFGPPWPTPPRGSARRRRSRRHCRSIAQCDRERTTPLLSSPLTRPVANRRTIASNIRPRLRSQLGKAAARPWCATRGCRRPRRRIRVARDSALRLSSSPRRRRGRDPLGYLRRPELPKPRRRKHEARSPPSSQRPRDRTRRRLPSVAPVTARRIPGRLGANFRLASRLNSF
jgi:hypothetical protein